MNEYLHIWTGNEYVPVRSVVFPRESKHGVWYGEAYNPSYKNTIRQYKLPDYDLLSSLVDLKTYTIRFYDCMKCKDRIVFNYKLLEDNQHIAFLHVTYKDGQYTRKVVLIDRLRQQRDILTRAS